MHQRGSTEDRVFTRTSAAEGAANPTSPGMDEALSCGSLLEDEFRQWDDFVQAHPRSSPFHLLVWKRTIEESFRYRPYYLVARGGDRVRAVLPLFLVRNPLLGKALISSPFAVYGGILADSVEARDALYGYVKGLGEELGVDYIELRNAWPEQCGGVSNVSRYVTFTQELAPDEAKLLESLSMRRRNKVRKSLKQPFRMEYDVREVGRLDEVHSRNMRRLGTPNFPRKYFARVLANFGEMADVREVWLDDKVMAVSLNFYYHGEMHTYHAAADSRFNALEPNIFMYFDHLRWAGQHGYRVFDFGRSKRDTGTFEFKKQWNTKMRELPYEVLLVNRKELPNFSPANPRFEIAIQAWRRLPLPVTRTLSRFVFPLFP
jgi:FemAB-related protein (PEP-CTERM system-associated)